MCDNRCAKSDTFVHATALAHMLQCYVSRGPFHPGCWSDLVLVRTCAAMCSIIIVHGAKGTCRYRTWDKNCGAPPPPPHQQWCTPKLKHLPMPLHATYVCTKLASSAAQKAMQLRYSYRFITPQTMRAHFSCCLLGLWTRDYSNVAT